MEINLSKCKWKIKGYWPYMPILGESVETGMELLGVTEWIPASVPGSVHEDLYKQGIIQDPYYEDNSIKCEWVENRWWVYRTEFQIDRSNENKNIALVFKGIDYKCYIYLNRKRLLEHEGMYEPINCDITGKVKFDTENTLEVILESVPKEMGQIGYTSMVKTQKARFGYKWDFCTRLVHIGIWDDVYLKITSGACIEDVYVKSAIEGDNGIVETDIAINVKPDITCTINANLYYEDKLIDSKAYPFENCIQTAKKSILFNLENPHLWWPNGYGEQALYQMKITVYADSELSDEYNCSVGIRKLEYEKNDSSPEDALPYVLRINGKRIYIKGSNLAPLDQMYGAIPDKKYEDIICLIKEANINLVRINGVGIIEKDVFYKLCDKYGIMVWQDFIQSGSGIDNIPPKDKKYLELLKNNSIGVIKGKRNYTSLTYWCGGNELRGEDGRPATYDNANIKLLKDLVQQYDTIRMLLPTTASGPNEFLDISCKGEDKNHDVHGPWKYDGTEKHYEVFNHSDSLFHSEFGVDGFTNPNALKRFLSADNRILSNVKDNLIWRHHGEWWDTTERDIGIFGDMKDMSTCIKCSQFIQAEGLRYAVESNRRRKFKNSGSMIWQFNEPWPNIANTCVVDYYGTPKMAYYWLKQAYSPIHVSLAYDKLSFSSEENFSGRIFVHNSLHGQELRVNLQVLDIKGELLFSESYDSYINGNSAEMVAGISLKIPEVLCGIFFVRATLYSADSSKLDENLYVFSQLKTNIFAPLLNLKKASFIVERDSEGYRIKNTGDTVCLFLYGYETNGYRSILINDNYTTLFPGEEKLFHVYPVGFKSRQSADISVLWDCFNN